MKPYAREDGLVVREVADETLIYDLERHKAHCLNQSAAFVWRHCDGRRSVPDITKLLEKELKTPVGDEVVWFTLQRLEKASLLKEKLDRSTNGGRVTRRDAMKRMGLAAALAMPVIMSIRSPTAAQAGTGNCKVAVGQCNVPAGNCVGCCCANGKRCTSTGCDGPDCDKNFGTDCA